MLARSGMTRFANANTNLMLAVGPGVKLLTGGRDRKLVNSTDLMCERSIVPYNRTSIFRYEHHHATPSYLDLNQFHNLIRP